MYWAILKNVGTGGRGSAWTLLPGRKYKTEAGVQRAFRRLTEKWDTAARRYEIHPSWLGKFSQIHRIVCVPDGQTLKTADLGAGNYYMGLAQ